MNRKMSHVIALALSLVLVSTILAPAQEKTELYTDAEGKQRVEQGRWTDVLMKQDGKWLLIADHGGPSASEDD